MNETDAWRFAFPHSAVTPPTHPNREANRPSHRDAAIHPAVTGGAVTAVGRVGGVTVERVVAVTAERAGGVTGA